MDSTEVTVANMVIFVLCTIMMYPNILPIYMYHLFYTVQSAGHTRKPFRISWETPAKWPKNLKYPASNQSPACESKFSCKHICLPH